MAKEIIIQFNPDGSVKLEAEGFVGTECLQATLPYEKALGMTKNNSTKKMKVATPKEGVRVASRNRIHTRR